ncbi:hypothetical protein IKU74_07060 [bacterium]|nr:hypothetical protein [bacterium]
MADGLIDGLKKLFVGKNITKKHFFLFGICLLTMFPVAFIEGDVSSNNLEMIKQLIDVGGWAVIMHAVGIILISLYLIHFIHNALKFFIWREHQEDIEKTKAIQITPEINKTLFNHFGSIVIYYILLVAIVIGLLIPVIATIWIPFVNILMILAFGLLLSISLPYMFVGFCKNYNRKGNLSPMLLFNYFPKVFLPTLILGLKTIVFGIGLLIIELLGAGIVAILFQLFAPEKIVSALTMSIIMYIYILGILAYYYALTYIYYDRIELTKEI